MGQLALGGFVLTDGLLLLRGREELRRRDEVRGLARTSLVGSPPFFAALIQTGIALATTMRVSSAKRA